LLLDFCARKDHARNAVHKRRNEEISSGSFIRLLRFFRYLLLSFLRLLPIAVRAVSVQIDQNIPGFSAFARPNDTAIFELIHNTGRAAIAESQSSLQ